MSVPMGKCGCPSFTLHFVLCTSHLALNLSNPIHHSRTIRAVGLVITHESWRFGECFRRGLSRNVGFMVIELGAVWPAVVRWG